MLINLAVGQPWDTLSQLHQVARSAFSDPLRPFVRVLIFFPFPSHLAYNIRPDERTIYLLRIGECRCRSGVSE